MYAVRYSTDYYGCHTWYTKLVTNNQEEIVKIVRDVIAASKHYDWYEFTTKRFI